MNAPQLNEKFVHAFHFTEEQIIQYAKISGDVNPIHVDYTFGENSILAKT